jgi:hypothetical protein
MHLSGMEFNRMGKLFFFQVFDGYVIAIPNDFETSILMLPLQTSINSHL